MKKLAIVGIMIATLAVFGGVVVGGAGPPYEPGNERGLFVVKNATAQFGALKHHGEALGWRLDEDDGAPDASQANHYQGVVRYPGTGTPIFYVTQKESSQGGYLHVVKFAGRPTTGERLRSNLQEIGEDTQDTLPANAGDTWVRSLRFDGSVTLTLGSLSAYEHPGGLAIVDDVLFVSLDTKIWGDGPAGYIVLFDLRGHRQAPTLIRGLGLDHSIDNLAVTEQADGTFLVWTVGAGGSVTKFYKTNGPDLRDEHLSISQVQNYDGQSSADFDGSACGQNRFPVDPPKPPAIPDGNVGSHQSSTFVREPDGSLYLIGMRNSYFGMGGEYADLYQVDPKATGGFKLTCLQTRRFYCYAYTSEDDRICNFAAANNAYVSPSGELILYGVPHDDQDWPDTDFVRMGEFRHRDVNREGSPLRSPTADANGPYSVDEGRTVVLSGSGSQPADRPWVELYEDDSWNGRSIVVDYDDRSLLELDDLNNLDGFNDKTTSVRWRAPAGLNIVLYDDHDYDNTDRYIVLYGTGDTEAISDLDTQDVVTDLVEQFEPIKAAGEDLQFDDKTSSLAFAGSLPTLSRTWDLDGDGVFGETGANAERGNETGAAPTFSAVGLGGPSSQTVKFRVCCGSYGCTVATAEVIIAKVAPLVEAGPDQLTNEGTFITLDPATFTHPALDELGLDALEDFHATVDWGDGTSEPAPDITFGLILGEEGEPNTGTVQASHAYGDDGNYTVEVCVTDDDGDEDCDSFSVTVRNVVPTVEAGANQVTDEGTFIHLDPATFSDPGFDNPAGPTAEDFAAFVDWGDGTSEPVTDITLLETPGSEGVLTTGTVQASHAYGDNGTYTVAIRVTDDEGGETWGSFVVTVGNVAPAVTAGADQQTDEGTFIDLDPATFSDPGFDHPAAHTAENFAATVDWGDGTVEPLADLTLAETPGSEGVLTTGTVQASHAYGDNGVYTVQVCVADDDGLPTCDSFIVTVSNVAPTVQAGANQETDEGTFIHLDPATFSDPGFDNPAAPTAEDFAALVDWGDGTSEPVTDITLAETPGSEGVLTTGTVQASHAYGDHGLYTVQVCVADDDGLPTCDSFIVTVGNVAPTVEAGANQETDEGTFIYLGPATFSDPGFDNPAAPTLEDFVATVNWGDGTAEPLADITLAETPGSEGVLTTGTVQASHAYGDDGVYTVQVCVMDDDGDMTCDTFTVTVVNVNPTLNAGQDQVIYEGDVVTLDPATFSDPGFDNPAAPTAENFAATVDWGDGTTEPVGDITLAETPGSEGVSTAGTIAASHPYRVPPGVYTITVTVADDDGGMDEDTLTVTVLRGFLRFCAYADRLRVTVEQGAVLDCALVPSGIPGGLSEGGLGSRGDLDVRGGAAIHGTLRSLAGDILVGRDAVVTGTVAAGSDVKADRRSQIGSSIQSGHRVELGRDVMVLGDVTAADSVKVDPRATVTGEINAFADVAPIPDVTWVQFSFEPGSEKVTVQKDSSRTLNPGSYGDVAVKKDATLILVSGQYVFDKFQLDQGAQLEFDLSAGAVVIDVAQNLDFGNDVQMQVVSAAGDAQDILFRVAGTVVDLGEGGVFLGTFLAPDAQIQMRQEASLNGAVYGRMVRVQQHAHLTGMPARDLCASLLVNP